MKDDKILDMIISLCDDVAWARPFDDKELFNLTADKNVPEKLSKLAESFGLMLVKVESRDLYNTRLIEELTTKNMELEEAKQRLQTKNSRLIGIVKEKYSGDRIVGQCSTMQAVIKIANNIAKRPINTMLLGETGTGKEVFAKYIHFNSPRYEAPFVPVNCTAIPEALFESEMFGIEKGVATGVNHRKGLFEEANGGTLFLDELADMSLPNQAKLLRALEEQEIYRVGSSKPIPVNVKVISATNVNIVKAMQEGKFRPDLYYRLAVAEIRIPPLHERGEDVILLAQKFLDGYCKQAARPSLHLSESVKKAFLQYAWPGNVRELNNEMERLSVLCFSDCVEFSDLSQRIQDFFQNSNKLPKPRLENEVSKEDGVPSIENNIQTENYFFDEEEISYNLLENEEKLVIKTLKHCDGNRTKAAALLGITREGLRKKLIRMGLDK